MKKQLVTVLAMILFAGALVAAAQSGAKAVAEIPFSFIAAGKTLPPGPYQFNPGKVPNQIIVRNNKTGESVLVPVITRLGPKADNEPMIVFDKADNDHYFSELYLPGFDGYAVQGFKGEHTHVQLKATK